jgi:hypothetical protein
MGRKTEGLTARIEHSSRVREDAQKREPASEIPYRRRNHAAWPRDPLHLSGSALGIWNEVEHQ